MQYGVQKGPKRRNIVSSFVPLVCSLRDEREKGTGRKRGDKKGKETRTSDKFFFFRRFFLLMIIYRWATCMMISITRHQDYHHHHHIRCENRHDSMSATCIKIHTNDRLRPFKHNTTSILYFSCFINTSDRPFTAITAHFRPTAIFYAKNRPFTLTTTLYDHCWALFIS